MRRRRSAMEPIQNKKACRATFEKRKKGLMKKAYEFSTLCGVDVCMIIYSPNFEGQAPQPVETWPQHSREVMRIIHKYDTKIAERKKLKNYDMQDFFKYRKNKVDAEISRVQKETLRMMYPTTWDSDYFNALGEDELRGLVTKLDAKIDACNQRINMLNKQRCCLKAQVLESDKAIPDPRSHLINLMPSQAQLSLVPTKPYIDNYNQIAFCDPSPLSQMFHCHQNVESSSLSYYNGSAHTMQPWTQNSAALQNLPLLPQWFPTDNGYYNMLQPQIPHYKH